MNEHGEQGSSSPKQERTDHNKEEDTKSTIEPRIDNKRTIGREKYDNYLEIGCDEEEHTNAATPRTTHAYTRATQWYDDGSRLGIE